MKYLVPVIAASAILLTAFGANATDTQPIIKAPQKVMQVDIKSDTSEFDTMSRKCPPFCI